MISDLARSDIIVEACARPVRTSHSRPRRRGERREFVLFGGMAVTDTSATVSLRADAEALIPSFGVSLGSKACLWMAQWQLSTEQHGVASGCSKIPLLPGMVEEHEQEGPTLFRRLRSEKVAAGAAATGASAGGRAGREADSRPLPAGATAGRRLRGAGSPRSECGSCPTQHREFFRDVRSPSAYASSQMKGGCAAVNLVEHPIENLVENRKRIEVVARLGFRQGAR